MYSVMRIDWACSEEENAKMQPAEKAVRKNFIITVVERQRFLSCVMKLLSHYYACIKEDGGQWYMRMLFLL